MCNVSHQKGNLRQKAEEEEKTSLGKHFLTWARKIVLLSCCCWTVMTFRTRFVIVLVITCPRAVET